MEKKKTILLSAAVVMVAVGGFWMLGSSEAKSTVSFATENVKKSNISNSITATGTIEPVTEVEVGTQVSGIIDKIYVDYNSVVTKGELIAEMDKICPGYLRWQQGRIRLSKETVRTQQEVTRQAAHQ